MQPPHMVPLFWIAAVWKACFAPPACRCTKGEEQAFQWHHGTCIGTARLSSEPCCLGFLEGPHSDKAIRGLGSGFVDWLLSTCRLPAWNPRRDYLGLTDSCCLSCGEWAAGTSLGFFPEVGSPGLVQHLKSAVRPPSTRCHPLGLRATYRLRQRWCFLFADMLQSLEAPTSCLEKNRPDFCKDKQRQSKA